MATFLTYNQEDWMHFDANSLKEGVHLAMLSYMQWNPRIGEVLMYVQGGVMDNPLLLFQLFHPLCLVLLVHFCFRLGTGRWAGGKAGDVVGLLFCILSVLSIPSGIYWFNGNTSWLYPCTVAAGLLIAVERVFRGDFHFSLGRVLWMLPLAVITGMSNNNTSVVVTLLICATWPYAILKQKRWIWPSAGCCLLFGVLVASFLCYYLAPGNAARMAVMDWELSFDCWWNRSILFAGNWQFAGMILFCPLFMTAVLLGITFISRQWTLLKNPRLLLVGVVCFLLWAVLTLAPVWGMPRAFVPIDIAFACLLAGMVSALMDSSAKRIWIAGAFVLHLALALGTIVPHSCREIEQGKVLDEIRAQACAAAAAGKRELVLEASSFRRKVVMPGATWCPNFLFHRTYGISTPLYTCKRSHYQEGKLHHQWGELPYKLKGGVYIGEAGNSWLAKPCGLDAIYCLED